ncbi:methyl-accepting chemotaxis protein [Salmonella enterica]|uniref:Methyl-accepting chemotaxis citrate transducer n=3 Tax=Salmonella enterica TaxID=28901 RepID=A0A379QEH2_SALER|nr:methyl-accepting chemotaxis citrate transducer [Salmonella enterica]
MKIKYFFLNLKLNKKMFLGFFIMLIIMIAIMSSGLLGLSKIRDHVDKNAISIELLNNLSAAKLSRISYEFSGNPAFVKQNKSAMEALSHNLERLYQFQWSDNGLTLLDKSQEALKKCFAGREAFDAVMAKKQAIQKRLDSHDFYLKSTELHRWSYDQALPPDQRMRISQLSFEMSDLDSLLGEYQELPTEAQQQEIKTHIAKSITYAEQLLPQLSSDQQALVRIAIQQMRGYADDVAPFRELGQNLKQVSDKLAADATNLAKNVNGIHKLMQQRVAVVSRAAKLQMELVASIGIFAGIVLAWLITRSITLPLMETLRLAAQIAEGDLTHDLKVGRGDEIGLLMQSMSTMNKNLKNIIHDVREGVECVARSSGEIASGNIDLSSRTEEQAAAVVETAASMEELTSTIALNAANVKEALKLSESAAKKANEGCLISRTVIESMKNVQSSSHRISEITSVINGIAFQTNILALNAAVEAARAGEQGKGFAVVAGEVRNLAQRSAQSAKEIEELIAESVEYVDSGFLQVERSGVAIADIEQSVTQMRNIMSDIAVATDEQSRGVSQIALAMAEMDTTTQQNAALVEESSAAASSLEEQALKLEEAISVFRVAPDDSTTPRPTVKSKAISLQTVSQEAAAGNWVKF